MSEREWEANDAHRRDGRIFSLFFVLFFSVRPVCEWWMCVCVLFPAKNSHLTAHNRTVVDIVRRHRTRTFKRCPHTAHRSNIYLFKYRSSEECSARERERNDIYYYYCFDFVAQVSRQRNNRLCLVPDDVQTINNNGIWCKWIWHGKYCKYDSTRRWRRPTNCHSSLPWLEHHHHHSYVIIIQNMNSFNCPQLPELNKKWFVELFWANFSSWCAFIDSQWVLLPERLFEEGAQPSMAMVKVIEFRS